MLILQIRQAETALADGRLDEAYELARSEQVRGHRQGQALIGKLSRAFVERGRQHLDQQRWADALADCEKAGKLGGNLLEAAELRAAIAEGQAMAQHKQRKHANGLAGAKQQMDAGQLSLAENLLATAEADSTRHAALTNEVAARRNSVEKTIASIDSAIDRQAWDAAIEGVIEVRRLHHTHPQLAEVTTRVIASTTERIRAALVEGRLDLAEVLLGRLSPLAGRTVAIEELRGLLGHLTKAAVNVQNNDPREAAQMLRRANAMLPEATWITQAVENLQQVAERMERVCSGPLGHLADCAPPPPQRARVDIRQAPTLPVGEVRPARAAHRADGGDTLPEKFMLHVDGAGSYLVVRDRKVSIGPISSSRCPDVGLMAEPGLPGVSLERNDEDYFLTAEQPVGVNGSATTRKLLCSGDRIELSPRCRLDFTLPHAASTSAVVNLSGTRLPRGDARRVILMDRSVVLGPGTSSHVRMDHLAEPVVLFVRNGQLVCQTREAVTVDDRPVHGEGAAIGLGSNVRAGALSFTVTAV